MNNTLESNKLFPYIAWALIVGFAVFTYMLTVRLQNDLSTVDSGIEDLDQRLKALEAQQQNKANSR
jgi:hypothetical protein